MALSACKGRSGRPASATALSWRARRQARRPDWRHYLFHAVGLFEQTGDGVLLRSRTDHIDWFAGHLAGLPFDFSVRAPDALRESVARP